RDDHPLFRLRKIREELTGLGVEDLRSHGHAQHHVVGALAVLVLAAAVLPAASADPTSITKIEEGAEARIGLEGDITSAAAVTARGAPEGDEFFPAERHAPVTAVAGDRLK